MPRRTGADRIPNVFDSIKSVSPRVRLAMRLHETGAVRTKREASQAAGLHPAYYSMLSARNPVVGAAISDFQADLNNREMSTATLLVKLGEESVRRIAMLARHSQNEMIQLKASVDLADRSPDTSKIQKHQVSSFSVSSSDVASLAASMVESSRLRAGLTHLESGDFIKVPSTGDSIDG